MAAHGAPLAEIMLRERPIHHRHIRSRVLVARIRPIALIELPALQQWYAHCLPISRRHDVVESLHGFAVFGRMSLHGHGHVGRPPSRSGLYV